jgi:hydrogenase maturation protein HypF
MYPEATPTVQGTGFQRLRVFVRGAVQGVGFRPFIYRLAAERNLTGWVRNSSQGVSVEVEGDKNELRRFLVSIDTEKPPRSSILSMESSYLEPAGFAGFEIRESDRSGSKTTIVLPDISTCENCLAEILDPDDRRYRYPFTNCTNCGPRYSIIEALPYDRPNTTMKAFKMCPTCSAEYNDPVNRRFHAQPNACPECGPKLALWSTDGSVLAERNDALLAASDSIRHGEIVAVKGLGGFHLMVDASNDAAVNELRRRKHREEKPLALMFPSLEAAAGACEASDLERRALSSPERPIVILKARAGNAGVSSKIAPNNPYLGCMLPYTPLHHLLMQELGFPIVATSGNLSDEPICYDESEALSRLRGIADLFLVHDRPIARHVDDSIVRVMAGREAVMRRARGFAPLPIPFQQNGGSILAVGAHLKNTIAASAGGQSFISQHIGDLETPQAFAAFKSVIGSLKGLYEMAPTVVACDKHPDYVSTRFSRDCELPRIEVQHHFAHVLSCMAENEIESPVLGVAWDGTGIGDDGTIWGGEFLRVDRNGFERTAHFRAFPLPGGEKAVREPRRSALGAIYETIGDRVFDMSELDPVRAFNSPELGLIRSMLAKEINSPITSSVGRLFDAVASIIGLRQFAGFEGQAAMELEFSIGALRSDESYQFEVRLNDEGPAIVDWGKAIAAIMADIESGASRALIAARFHNMLAETVVRIASLAGLDRVALSGGCFQNKYLLERVIERLCEEGFRPFWHQRVPTNDGGISLGQTLAAARALAQEDHLEANTKRRTAICV